MQLIRHPERFDAAPSAVAIGNFDGLHRGHRAVIAQMQAASDGLVPSVLTFEPHPRRVFTPGAELFRLEPLGSKLRRLREAGVEQVFMPRFTRAFAGLTAMEFLDDVLAGQLNAKAVVTGENFAFGKGRRGDVALLKEWGAERGVAVHAVAPVTADGEMVSSSAVRQAIAAGEMEHAAALLGRPYQLAGRVVHGDGAGRGLGYPTANIALPPGLKLPRYGIYAVRALVRGVLRDGVVSFGVRPTVSEQTVPWLELHLFDFADDVYGERIAVDFVSFLRGEEKFETLEALVEKIGEDCVIARKRLEART